VAERAAIYYAPPPGTLLAAFAEAWFGRDDNREATASPRRYGFHATLKPPFRFAEGTGMEGLREDLRRFAKTRPPVEIGHLQVAELSGFLALVPVEAPASLPALAQACVERFDPFRAAPTEDELARRRAKPLSERQEELLHRWGYPYVDDQFRFHMTLTGKLPDAERAHWRPEIERLAAEALAEPMTLGALSIFRQSTPDAAFQEIDRESLAGVP
jgi:2'-5' RNA ligase